MPMSTKLPLPKPAQESLSPGVPVVPKRSAAAASQEVVRQVLAESILTSKGQVTIPKAIRSLYQLDEGDSLVWRQETDGRLVVEPKRSFTLADIRSAIAAAGVPSPPRAFTDEEMDDAIAQGLEAKFGRH